MKALTWFEWNSLIPARSTAGASTSVFSPGSAVIGLEIKPSMANVAVQPATNHSATEVTVYSAG